ncbi:MAG: hypothetical protein GKR97_18665 [Rhizobiaceae bacterium]|nr:hypothetical protein [Rhizobiaceae bacterium]
MGKCGHETPAAEIRMPEKSDQIELLKEALLEAQQTVRAYDTKAQIVGVGYIFALGVVFKLGELLPKMRAEDITFVILAWAIIILPILLFGVVLYPTRKSLQRPDGEGYASNNILYFSPDQFLTPSDYLEALQKADPIAERTHELLQVSHLRSLKRKRFLRALFSSGIAFVALFAAQLWRSAVL